MSFDSGERFWASGEISPLLGDAGHHIGYVKVLRDRTEGYVATQAFGIAEARLRQAQEAGGIGLLTVAIAEYGGTTIARLGVCLCGSG